MPPYLRQTVPVACPEDALVARRSARFLAKRIGFDERASEEIAIAVGELASNLARHAGGGRVVLRQLAEEQRVGIEIESVDAGPGIANLEQAIGDGFSTAGSLGFGLGTVNRLMDDVDITTRRGTGSGTRILCRRWVRAEESTVRPSPVDIGAATRPHPMRGLNGDAFLIRKWRETALVGVIDGLGHGKFARHAAQTARQYVEAHFDRSLESIFWGAGRACRATRGVVMALARVDWGRETLSLASIGNIEVRLAGSSDPMSLVARRGVIGLNAPRPVTLEHRWEPTCTMVMHSDGLSSRWRWEDFAHLQAVTATVMAQHLLSALGKQDDDATVLVVRGAQGPAPTNAPASGSPRPDAK